MKKLILFSLCLLMAGQVFGLVVIKKLDASKKTVATNSRFAKSETKETPRVDTIISCGHKYVDLGLPSGTKWATCNIGASSPEKFGDYFAWGETSMKADYSLENYLKDLGGSMFSYDDCGTSNDPLANYVHPNEKSIAGTQYDVAHVWWGGSWKMPTLDQMKELYDSNNCTTTWTIQNGVEGRKIVSKKNGNSIFLPAAGFVNESALIYKGECGTYWCSTPYPGEAFAAYYHEFGSSYVDWYHGRSRNYGRTVRPVIEESVTDNELSEPINLRNSFSRDGNVFTVNGVSFTMIEVQGGTFTMGATSEQEPAAEMFEKPAHQVTLSSYMIGETEVTQALWQAVMGRNPSCFKGNNKPVEQVSWNDCQTFISKLNSITGENFRLPTEAEWEYAARGGNHSRGYMYSGSDNLGNVAWYGGNSGNTTHDVKTKSPNELGIYDMSGNVDEWCSDCFDSYSSSPQVNPTGRNIYSSHVYRGGCWFYHDGRCRSSCRRPKDASDSRNILGLRLVADANKQTQDTPAEPRNSFNRGENVFTVNGVSFAMIEVQGGTFIMGTTPEQKSFAYDDREKPAHLVTLSDYMIGETEVTQALWEAVMGSNPSFHNGKNKPVEWVNWNDCQVFISKLNSITGENFRLPTEAEWEYAARGGNRSRGYKFSGSDKWEDVAWNCNNSGDKMLDIDSEIHSAYLLNDDAGLHNNCRTHEVATKQPNELGIYDMSGNVSEWCSDRFGRYSSGSQTNPKGRKIGSYRVYRGGSWRSVWSTCHSLRRYYNSPSVSSILIGLRLAL